DVADVGVHAIAARRAVGAVGKNLRTASGIGGAEVDVVIAPGVLGQAAHVAAGAPVPRFGRAARTLDQRPQALVRARIIEIIHAVHFQRAFQRADIVLGLGNAGLIGPVENIGYAEG